MFLTEERKAGTSSTAQRVPRCSTRRCGTAWPGTLNKLLPNPSQDARVPLTLGSFRCFSARSLRTAPKFWEADRGFCPSISIVTGLRKENTLSVTFVWKTLNRMIIPPKPVWKPCGLRGDQAQGGCSSCRWSRECHAETLRGCSSENNGTIGGKRVYFHHRPRSSTSIKPTPNLWSQNRSSARGQTI